MFSKLVDIPRLFRRLDALPRELATARQELWAADVEVNEALRDYEDSDETTHSVARGRFLTMRDEKAAREANLADLNDEMVTLRMQVDLITALALEPITIEAPIDSNLAELCAKLG